MDFMTVLKVD